MRHDIMRVVVLVLMFGVILEAQGLQCWSYDPTKFIAWKGWIEPGKKHPPGDEVKPIGLVYVVIPEKIEQYKPITLIAQVAGRNYSHADIYCDKKKEGHACGGECDSGQLQLRKDIELRLRLESLSFLTENDMGEPVTELQLKARDKSVWLRGDLVDCPDYALKGLYVCYDKHEGEQKNQQYIGCQRAKKACESIGKKHFGHYPDEYTADKALYRCLDSKPRFIN